MRVDARTLLALIRPELARGEVAGHPRPRIGGQALPAPAPAREAVHADARPPALLPPADAPAGAAPPSVILWLPAAPPPPPHPQSQDAPPESSTPSRPPDGEVAFVLHDPAHGPIEVRLALVDDRVRAAVTTPAGALADRAAAGRDELAVRLERATGRTAVTDVRARAPTHRDAPKPLDLHA